MAKAPGLMTWLSPSVVRALLLSAIALVGSVALYNQYQATQELDHAQTLRDQKERYFSGLCFDSLTIDQVQIKDAKHDIQLRLKDRWRTADGGVIEDRKLQIVLAELRGLQVERMDHPNTLESLGLEPPKQALMVKSSIDPDVCHLSLGAKHPTKPLFVLQRNYQQKQLIGWAKVKTSADVLIDSSLLEVETILPLSVGQIDSLAVEPQVGLSAYQIRRRPGYYLLKTDAKEVRADRVTVEHILNQLVGLKGELQRQPIPLSDPDFILTIGHSPLKTRLAFYTQTDRLIIATKDLVFEAENSDLSWLIRKAASWRDLQLTHYERGQTRVIEVHDGSGRVFRYRREIDDQGGLDQWFQGEKSVVQAHRLSGLQWDLHRLRGIEIIDELNELECLSGCARIRVFDDKQVVLVDTSIDRRGKDAFIQRLGGPVLRIEAKTIEHWPLAQLN